MELQDLTIIFDKYNISEQDRIKLSNIIIPIINHEEFIKRSNPDTFPHHDKISLGFHICSDAIVTYLLSKKHKLSEKEWQRAVTIAMFHDLYELPWQNNPIKKNMFVNKHGFVHPLEGVINAATWYPEYFENKKQSDIIIDGIVHHMFPFPVRALDDTNPELNNQDKFNNLDSSIQNLIIESSNRSKLGHISLCRSKYIEGRIMSNADKAVSLKKELINFHSLKACITGKNPNLK